METDVIYKYHAPGSPLGHATTIATGTLRLEPSEVLTTHRIGEVVELQSDDLEENGEVEKEYVVLDRFPLLSQIDGSGFEVSILIVIVTDPNE